MKQQLATDPDQLVLDEIAAFLRDSLGLGGVDSDTDLYAEGLIDSLKTIDLVIFLENRFEISLDARHLTAETMATPRRIATLVQSLARQ